MVEFVRSSFVSEWRLFKARPDILTSGRYVVAPPGTPHYPGYHNFWSRDWVSDELSPVPPLGENVDTKRKWDNGAARAVHPPAGLIGSADCITNGERFPLPMIDRTFHGGFDSRCYLIEPIPPEDVPLTFDVRSVDFQVQMTTVLSLQYTNSAAAASEMASVVGPGYTVTHVPNSSSTVPGTIIAVGPDRTFVVISGTTTPQQWALQGMGGLEGPVNQGTYSTLPLWQASAEAIIQRLIDSGANMDNPIYVIGHSYGGAVADIITVKLLQGNINRPVQLLTFGAPRPGDIRIVNLMRPATQVHLANQNDPVPAIPPSTVQLAAFSWLVPLPVAEAWQSWQSPPGTVTQNDDGTRQVNTPDRVPYEVLLDVIRKTLTGTPVPEISAHSMEEYNKRALLAQLKRTGD